MDKRKLFFKKIIQDAILPNGKHNDICSMIDCVVGKQDFAVIKTGLAVNVPDGYILQITSKRTLAEKHMVVVMNSPAVIHPGSEEEILVILMNNSVVPFPVNVGYPIAQLNLVPVSDFIPFCEE